MKPRLLPLFFLLACDNQEVKSIELPLDGALKCDQSKGLNAYTKPVMLELRDGDDFHRETLSGNFEPHGAKVTITGKRRTWTVRFGECANTYDGKVPPGRSGVDYDCGDAKWYSETKLEVDPAKPPPIKFVPPPTPLSCWRRGRPRSARSAR